MSRPYYDPHESCEETIGRILAERDEARVEVERLREENRDLRDGFGVDEWWQLEKAEATIERVRKVRDDTELANHNSLLWQRLAAALDGETDE